VRTGREEKRGTYTDVAPDVGLDEGKDAVAETIWGR